MACQTQTPPLCTRPAGFLLALRVPLLWHRISGLPARSAGPSEPPFSAATARHVRSPPKCAFLPATFRAPPFPSQPPHSCAASRARYAAGLLRLKGTFLLFHAGSPLETVEKAPDQGKKLRQLCYGFNRKGRGESFCIFVDN